MPTYQLLQNWTEFKATGNSHLSFPCLNKRSDDALARTTSDPTWHFEIRSSSLHSGQLGKNPFSYPLFGVDFSVESSLELADCSTPNRIWVHRSFSEKVSESRVLPKQAQSRKSVMVWDAISSLGRVTMCFVAGHINAESYIQILDLKLLPFRDSFPLQYQKTQNVKIVKRSAFS